MSYREEKVPVTFSRTLGVREVTLLGVGALLGGGIFTLLGHAAGLAGGGLVVAMAIGAGISFLNLNSYIALATTFPEAGGGYLWVKEGLGDLQGFFSGWISWMAHSVACALYAASFGIFAVEFLFSLLGVPLFGISPGAWALFFTVGVILIFGMVNYRGAGLTGKIGSYISLAILSILTLFIVFGFKKIGVAPSLLSQNFSPFFSHGLLGVLQAASLFYIAFEGSEIQAQTGEEARDPARTLKISLFSSWAIISALYLLISFVVVGATDASGMPSWQILGQHADRAIIESAKQFMPLGWVLMVVGGILANIAALNATIYSSSRVLFAMARDNFVWARFGDVHHETRTPYRAVILSLVAIIFVAVFLPLKDIAGAADMLFIALFLQLNLAYIELRRKKPEARWYYVVPFGPVFPLLAVGAYIILGISLFHVSPLGIYFTLFWILLGMVNYLGYTKTEEREALERETRYEHATRFREKLGYRVILPVASEKEWYALSHIASAMAKNEGGELLAVRIHEVPPSLPLSAGFHVDHERRLLEKVEKLAAGEKLNVATRLVAARSIPDAILEMVEVEKGNLLIMGWDGYVNTKGFIFGRKVDVVLHRVKADLLVVKLHDFSPTSSSAFLQEGKLRESGANHSFDSMKNYEDFREYMGIKKIFIPVAPDANPNLRFAGKVGTALAQRFGAEVTVGMVIPEHATDKEAGAFHALMEEHVGELKLKLEGLPRTKFITSNFIASAILKEAEQYDLLLLPAARGRMTKAIGVGSIPERVAKHSRQVVIIAKGHRGIIQPFFDYLRSRF